MSVWSDFALQVLFTHHRLRSWMTGLLLWTELPNAASCQFIVPVNMKSCFYSMLESIVDVMQGMPAECLPHKLSWWQAVRLWTLSLMSWDQQDICESYHLALLVDPLWHVTPPKVCSCVCLLGLRFQGPRS